MRGEGGHRESLEEIQARELESIRIQAENRDVTHDLQRFFGREFRDGRPDLIEMQISGYQSEARKWLLSATPEGMRYGTYNREKRFQEAQKYASLAGISYEDLKNELGVEE